MLKKLSTFYDNLGPDTGIDKDTFVIRLGNKFHLHILIYRSVEMFYTKKLIHINPYSTQDDVLRHLC
jgi:hypothetical protein